MRAVLTLASSLLLLLGESRIHALPVNTRAILALTDSTPGTRTEHRPKRAKQISIGTSPPSTHHLVGTSKGSIAHNPSSHTPAGLYSSPSPPHSYLAHQATEDGVDLLEALLRESDPPHQSPHQADHTVSGHVLNSVESHEDFTKWMESELPHELDRYLGSHHNPTDRDAHASRSPHPSGSPPRHRFTPLPISSPSSQTSVPEDDHGYSSRAKRIKKGKTSSQVASYDKTQLSRLDDYYEALLKEYGWNEEAEPTLREKLIRNTPKHALDRIANGIIVRGGQGALPLLSVRKAIWSKNLSEEAKAKVIRFGDRLMKHRRGSSPTTRGELLASLTQDEIKAIVDDNEVEMKRIEAAKMPKLPGRPMYGRTLAVASASQGSPPPAHS